ncbi:hypothetical protein [Streptomyces sp. NBC_01506]|uniref:hypothetical protein n=1 Tax=Streptomyces sp. NBC_01506 TaxID=2903887 RepID=UPI00386E85B4
MNNPTDPLAPEAATSVPYPQPLVRDALMHTLAATEAVISRLSVMPVSIALTEHRGVYGISLHYFQDPGAVQAFASALGLDEVITSPNRRTYNTSLTEATTYIEGIPVHAWTQTEDLPLTHAGEVPAPADTIPAGATFSIQTLAQAAGQVSA